MVKFLAQSRGHGRALVGIVLSHEDLRLLGLGKAVQIDGCEMGLSHDIGLMASETEEVVLQSMVQMGLLPSGLLRRVRDRAPTEDVHWVREDREC